MSDTPQPKKDAKISRTRSQEELFLAMQKAVMGKLLR